MKQVKEMAAYRDGTFYGTGTAHHWIDEIGLDDTTVYKIAHLGQKAERKGHVWTLKYTGKMIDADARIGRPPSRVLEEHKRRKPKKTVSQVIKEARAAGMSYGQYVAMKGL